MISESEAEDVSPEKLYGSSETYALETLELWNSEDEIGSGGCGNIFRATITRSYGVQHKLYRGIWLHEKESPFDSFSYWTSGSSEDQRQKTKTLDQRITVAVKTIRGSEDEVLDLTREASSLRILQGTRNVASVHGVIYSRKMQSVCVVMELVEGPDLNSFLKSRRLASSSSWSWWKMKLEIFMELVIGLSVCHTRGVYHGDLKGNNVLVDRFMVPKLIDFGFSFRKTDVEYLKSLGGSPFWISPELCDGVDEIPPEVLQNPFPSDVYSLGMVLVELCIDGEIPEYMDSFMMMNKYMGSSPVELQVPEDMEEVKEAVFDEIFAVVDECCSADRDDRISLENCLARIQSVYSSLCSAIGLKSGGVFQTNAEEEDFASSSRYRDVLAVLGPEFPEVILQQPAKNMMVDIQGTLLVDLFCRLDFEEGVKFIIEKGAWNFIPENEVPRLCRICVKQGSPEVLRYLSQRWRDEVLREEWLMHDACEAESLEVLKVLLDDVRMDYDTWSRSGLRKPFHKLAFRGKVEMMKLLLERVDERDYINTRVLEDGPRPLNCAIEGDSLEAALFLLENGGTMKRPVDLDEELEVDDFLEMLFFGAIEQGSLEVATGLLEISYSIKSKGEYSPTMKLSHTVLQRFESHKCECLGYFEDEYSSYEYVLPLLQTHLVESRVRGVDPLSLACSEQGNREVFRLMVSLCYKLYKLLCPTSFEGKLWMRLGEHGSKEMVAYALEKLLKEDCGEVREAAMKHGNLELVEFLRTWKSGDENNDDGSFLHNAEKDARKDDYSGVSFEPDDSETEAEQHSGSEDEYELYDTVAGFCNAVVKSDMILLKNKLKKLRNHFTDNSTNSTLEDESLEHLLSLRGTELVEELEKRTLIWRAVAPTLLRTSAYSGNLEMVEHLMQRGVPVDGPEYNRGYIYTPLGAAVSQRHAEVAEKILVAGGDPNVRTEAGYTYMDSALGFKDHKLIRLLIRFGFDTGSKNRDNQTYMDLIAHLEE